MSKLKRKHLKMVDNKGDEQERGYGLNPSTGNDPREELALRGFALVQSGEARLFIAHSFASPVYQPGESSKEYTDPYLFSSGFFESQADYEAQLKNAVLTPRQEGDGVFDYPESETV